MTEEKEPIGSNPTQDFLALLKESLQPMIQEAVQKSAAPAAPAPNGEYSELLRDMVLQSYGVPEEIKGLIPADPVRAREFLGSEAYQTLKQKLEYVPIAAPEETPVEPASTGDKEAPGPAKPTKFSDIQDMHAFLSDLLKGVDSGDA